MRGQIGPHQKDNVAAHPRMTIPIMVAENIETTYFLAVRYIDDFHVGQFVLNDVNIQVKVGSEGTTLNLENLQKVVDAGDLYLLIYKDKQKFYFFIPQRAFNEDVTEKDFLNYLDEKSISVN